MRQQLAIFLALVCFASPNIGCRSTDAPLASNPFGGKSPAASGSQKESRFMSLFKKSQQQLAKQNPGQKSTGRPFNDPEVRQASGTENSAEFDAQTQALIDRKLAGASPEQRTQMRDALRGVPAHMVPQILNAFYLGQQLKNETPSAFDNPRSPLFGPSDPQSIANRSRREGRLHAPPRDDGQALASVRGNSRFAQPGAHGYDGRSPQPPLRQSQTFPGESEPVMQTGHVSDSFRRSDRVQQADWSTERNPQNAQTATRIGDYGQMPASNRLEVNSNRNISQTGHQANQPAQAPQDDLPLYQQPGQARSQVLGSLKPGEFSEMQHRDATRLSHPQGAIQRANMTPSSGGALSIQQTDGRPVSAPQWRGQLEQIIANAEREVGQLRPGLEEDSPQMRDYIENNVHLRMMYLMSGNQNHQARAWEPIPGLDPAHQEFWQYVMFGLSNYFDRNPQLVSEERYSEAVKSFGLATNKLRQKANLEIGDIAFCRSITNFGNYERFETSEFSPGQQVVLYAEIRNFTSRLTEDNHYQTMLTSTIEFLIPGTGPMGGRTVQQAIEMQPTEDLCKFPRQDFFIASLFSIPNDLAQGRYVLKLTVTDKLGRKFAESTLNFIVK